jgi:hypothetical protein
VAFATKSTTLTSAPECASTCASYQAPVAWFWTWSEWTSTAEWSSLTTYLSSVGCALYVASSAASAALAAASTDIAGVELAMLATLGVSAAAPSVEHNKKRTGLDERRAEACDLAVGVERNVRDRVGEGNAVVRLVKIRVRDEVGRVARAVVHRVRGEPVARGDERGRLLALGRVRALAERVVNALRPERLSSPPSATSACAPRRKMRASNDGLGWYEASVNPGLIARTECVVCFAS